MIASFKNRWAVSLCLPLMLVAIARSQESVEVPQILQENVRTFNLTIDSLNTLTEALNTLAQTTAVQLRAIRHSMDGTPVGTRAYHLERRRFEQKYSEFLLQKYHSLANMQTLRQQTLASLERIIGRLQKEDSTTAEPVREAIRDEIHQNDERLARTRIEMLQILTKLKTPELAAAESSRLRQRLRRLRRDQLELYQANQNRLAVLLAAAGNRNEDLPAMQNHLRTMWEHLQSGFAWIDAEMAYTRLFVAHRKNWLAIDAQLLEVSGLVERFGHAVDRLNESSEALREMEQMGELLQPNGAVRTPLPEVPALKWPGHPGESATDMTDVELDSLEEALQRDLHRPGTR